MQEIVLFLSSIAGACTAVAVKKFPKNKVEVGTIGANSQIKNQINSLRLEKEILTKTITRLYQNDAGLNKIQRDKLLLRYQHQLGIILAKIEKLKMASKHPDLGPVGEGLITLMDQKLSQLDKRLYELSSKITIANSQTPEVKTEVITQKEEIKKEKPVTELQEKPIQIKRTEEKPRQKVIIPTIQAASQLPISVELTTLTEISNKHSEFPFIEQKPLQQKSEIVEKIVKQHEKAPEKVEINQTMLKPEVKPEIPNQTLRNIVRDDSKSILEEKQRKMKTIQQLIPNTLSDAKKQDIGKEQREKIQSDIKLSNERISFLEMRKQDALTQILAQEKIMQRPAPQQNVIQIEQEKPQTSLKIPDEDKIEEDDNDLDRIKREINKTLSRLEQAEVE